MYEFVKAGTTANDNRNHAIFLAEVFKRPKLFTEDYIKWQYANHPAGNVLGYNAMYEGKIVAHFVMQPFPATVNGIFKKGLLAFNSATSQNHRGKGLFTTLARKTIDEAMMQGYEFIIAVTNHNSVQRFIKHLDFRMICQLDAKIGIGKIDNKSSSDKIIFEKFWDEKLLAWRLMNPLNKYFYVNGKYYSKTHMPLIKVFLLKGERQQRIIREKFNRWPVTLYIGRNKDIVFSKGIYFNIPERLKPSPLFLIFKDLGGHSLGLDANNIKFNLIDFDAY